MSYHIEDPCEYCRTCESYGRRALLFTESLVLPSATVLIAVVHVLYYTSWQAQRGLTRIVDSIRQLGALPQPVYLQQASRPLLAGHERALKCSMDRVTRLVDDRH